MDLDVNMRTGSCPYAVQFYGALFREVGAVFILLLFNVPQAETERGKVLAWMPHASRAVHSFSGFLRIVDWNMWKSVHLSRWVAEHRPLRGRPSKVQNCLQQVVCIQELE